MILKPSRVVAGNLAKSYVLAALACLLEPDPLFVVVMSSTKQFTIVALRQGIEFHHYWTSTVDAYVTLLQSKRRGNPPYVTWSQISGRGFIIWVSDWVYSKAHECYVVRFEMPSTSTDEGQEIYDSLVRISLDEFHSNEVLESGVC